MQLINKQISNLSNQEHGVLTDIERELIEPKQHVILPFPPVSRGRDHCGQRLQLLPEEKPLVEPQSWRSPGCWQSRGGPSNNDDDEADVLVSESGWGTSVST